MSEGKTRFLNDGIRDRGLISARETGEAGRFRFNDEDEE